MNTIQKFVRAAITLIGIFSILLSSLQVQPMPVSAQGNDGGIQRDYNAETGKVTHITGTGNEPITVMGAMSADMTSTERSDVLVERFAPEFGLTDPSEELVVADESQPEADRVVTKYQQVYQGVPVLGGELIVNASDQGELYSMNGEVSQGLALDTTPAISVETAIDIAKQGMTKWYGGSKADYQHTDASLYIFDESILRPSIRPTELVWKIEMTSANQGEPIRELVLVSAKTGNIPLHFNQIDSAWANTKAEPSIQYDDPTPTETSTPLPTETPVLTETPLPMETPLLTETTQPNEGSFSIQSVGDVTIQSGATWYVSTTGSDANDCFTINTPCLTIHAAANKAATGATIKVASGTYVRNAAYVLGIYKSITISGGWDSSFTTQSGESILDGQNVRQVIYISALNVVTMDRLTITNGNNINGNGGGIYMAGSTLTINNSTIKSNKAANGGGVFLSTNYNTITKLILNNSTVSGNEATYGGGAIGSFLGGDATGDLIINNSTIADNKALRGGGFLGVVRVTLNNSILAQNSASESGNDCYSGIGAVKNSIIQDMNCNSGAGTGYLHVDPMLSPILFGLNRPGYYTIKPGSPAIDGGDPATCLPTDQRGVTRPQGSTCDIGSYEYTVNGPATSIGYISGSNQKIAPKLSFDTPLAVYASDSTGAPVSNVSIRFEAPASGASGTFADTGTYITTVLTDGNGIAKAPIFAANSVTGIFNVTATANGLGLVDITSLENKAWHVSKSGSDSNTCATSADPCATITGAITKASAGDYIKVTGETYTGISNQVVYINKSVTILGGWTTDFETQNGFTTIDGQNTLGLRGIYVDLNFVPGIVLLDHFVIKNINVTSSQIGGGIYSARSTVELTNSLIKNNRSGSGAGIYAERSNLSLSNTTISNNSADYRGGGIYFADDPIYDQTLRINNSTIAYNSAGILNSSGEGGGLYVYDSYSGGARYASISNSILSNNIAINSNTFAIPGHNCKILGSQVQIAKNNIIPDPTGCNMPASGYNAANPLITSVLVGSPGHHALMGNSPALNTGDPATCPKTDQRGISRPQGTGCDIGAFERATVAGTPNLMTLYTGNNQRTDPGNAFSIPIAVYVSNSAGDAVSGGNITFTAPASGASGTFASNGNTTTIVTSDNNGIATAGVFTANTLQGDYTVTASASGLSPVSFNMQNVALYVSRSGQDTTNCTSPTQPCYNLNYAIGQAVAGDHIFVTGEIYDGALSSDSLVHVTKPIILSGGWNQSFTAQTGQTVLDLTSGRGIYVVPGSSAIVDRFDVRGGKLVNNFGGGILNSGSLTFTNGAIYNNSAHGTDIPTTHISSDGGGIYSNGTQLTLENVTISNNEADAGGGIFVSSGTTSLNNVTISQNFATNIGVTAYGGGIENKNNSPVTIQNTIIAGNSAEVGQDCYNLITSGGNNLIGYDAGCNITPASGDLIGRGNPLNAGLGDFGDNGGATKTHALLASSPAIDAGNPATCAATDQRGVTRPQGAACDIGAFEGSVIKTVTIDAKTYSAENSQKWPGKLLCDSVSNPNCTDPTADTAQKYAIGIYEFYRSLYNRNGIDNNNIPVISTVHYCSAKYCPYPDAYWTGAQIIYGDAFGFANADDYVAHEYTHGVIQFESNLYPFYQSGAISESLGDLWGEYYDQSNNMGNDSPEVKWLLGEDITGWTNPASKPLLGQRSMSNPTLFDDPDKMTSTLYYRGDADSGGIHWNSGVNNKAVYLMVEGGTFNGKTVASLDWEKTAAIYYEANTNLLTSASDYSDLYYAIQQACTNVVGQHGITPADCVQVKNAVDAVEMNKQPAANFTVDAPLCPTGMTTGPTLTLFKDDFENGVSNWETYTNQHWYLSDSYATSPTHMMWGSDSTPQSVNTLLMKNFITIPAGSTTFLHFKHAFAFEYDSNGYYDGGVLEYGKNGNLYNFADAKPFFSAGKNYSGTVSPYYGNYLKGRSGFVGDSHGYVSSRYNLSSLAGQSIKFRWRYATDSDYNYLGWFLDDVSIYQCVGTPAIPTLTAPAINTLITDYTPLLNWSDATPAIHHYQVQVAKENSFASPVYEQNDLTKSEFTIPADLSPNTTYYWHVRAFNAIDATLGWSPTWTFRTALTPPPLVTPNEGDHLFSLRPTFEWDDVVETGLTGYTIQISTSSTFATIAHTGNPVASSYTPTVDLPKGKLYWRVRTNGTNGPSAWSTRSYQGPYPLPTPVLSLPANNVLVTDYTPQFKWSVLTIPASAAPFDKYQLQVATDAGFTSLVLEEDISGVANNTFTPPTDFASNTKYYWRVRGVNTLPENGNWSAVWSFRTALLPVTLNALQNGDHPYTVRPTFTWSDPNLTAPLATGYSIQIGTSNAFATLVTSGTAPAGATSYVPTINLPGGKLLYWRVRANGLNGPSLWTSGSFTTPTPPSVPTLLFPANTSLNTNYTPTLKWSAVTSVVAFHHYQVQVDDDPLFLSPAVDDSTHTLASQNQLTTPALSPNTKFYWRVLAFNNDGQYSTSAVWSFRTIMLPVSLNALENGDHPYTLRPTFSWNDPNAAPLATGYSIQIATSTTFATLVTSGTAPAGATSYVPTVNLPAGKLLYWRVRANGINGPSLWTSGSFTTPTPPSVPTLLLPANTSLNTNYTPTLKWSVVTSVVAFHHYQVQVDDDPLFLSPAVDDSTHILASQNQLTTPSLPHNVKFYWRVLAFNNSGQYSTSAVWSFRTIIDAPLLVSPGNGDPTGTLKPVFDWDAPNGPVTSYTIQVATSPTFATLLVNSTTVDSTYTRLTNLPAAKTLYWRVRANGVNGPSAWSSVFRFTTP